MVITQLHRISTLVFVCSACLLSSCSESEAPSSTNATVSLTSTPVASTQQNQPSTRVSQTDPFEDAVATAEGAAITGTSAISRDDWELVAVQWQQAIDLLKDVPTTSPNYAKAKKKIPEYQLNLAAAKQNAQKTPVPKEPTLVEAKAAERALPKPKPVSVPARAFLEDYLYYITTEGGTGSGTGYFCKEYSDFASSLYTPTNAEILDLDEFTVKGTKTARATVRIDSSNKGGSPVRADWSFSMKKGPAQVERLPGGWCMALISEKG